MAEKKTPETEAELTDVYKRQTGGILPHKLSAQVAQLHTESVRVTLGISLSLKSICIVRKLWYTEIRTFRT